MNDPTAPPLRPSATAKSNIPPRARTKSDPPTERINTQQRPPSSHVQAVVDIIDYCVQVPLVSMAAVQTMRMSNDSTFVSPYAMDAYTIDLHKQPLAEGIANLAKNYPVLGALLDKISLVAPAGGLITVCMTIVAQLMENHGVGTFSAMPGVISRNELEQGLVAAGQKVASTNGNE